MLLYLVYVILLKEFRLLNKRYWSVSLLFIAAQVLSVAIPIGLHFTTGFNNITGVLYINIAVFVLAVFGSLALLRPHLRQEKEANPISAGKLIGWTVIGIFLAYGAQLVAMTIEMNVLGIPQGSENTSDIVELTRINPLFFIIPVFTAPILEELIFRKIIFGSLHKRMNFLLSVFISSLIFALVHLEFQHLLIYFGMGVALAYVYVKTKRIIVPILVHMGMNGIVIFGQLMIDPEELERMQQELSLILFGG